MPASHWPNQLCPYADCGRLIKDLLAEMVPDIDQTKPEFKALVAQGPGGPLLALTVKNRLNTKWMGKRWVSQPVPRFDIRERRWK
jgi:hypothetical protein